MSEIAPESEAQRRRRLRQERILNRGGDRLDRIKGTLSKAQAEADLSEMALAGGHELKTAANVECAPGISLVSTESEASEASAVRPRRRVGNLARRARQEAEEAESGRSTPPDAADRESRQPADTVDIDSTSLDEVLTAAIADPAGEDAQLAPDVLLADGRAAGGGLAAAVRQLSVARLARSVARLAPVVGVFVYGVRREAEHERLMGDSAADVHAKWAGLLAARPDGRLDEWAGGNYLLWYVIVVEAVLYGAYLALAGGRPRPTPSLLASIAGVPGWVAALLPAGRRVIDGAALLLLLAALSIVAA
ncbi:hypothetical protein H4R19_001800 [Coemansia spiralis]|nr:hypothetical protein H4R19_001800 [Coemansia spiralis]